MTRRDTAYDAAYRGRRSITVASVLRQAVAEGRPRSDAELHRRLGMTMPLPGAAI